MDDLTKEFLAESLEGLDRMDRCLTELESRPLDADLLGEIFRAVHTIKGATGFLGFGRLEKLAHAGENLLSSLRDGRLPVTPAIVSGLLRLMDGLRHILQLIDQFGHEGVREDDEDSRLIAEMGALDAGTGLVALPERVAEPQIADLTSTVAVAPAEKTLRIDVDVLNRMMNLVGELVLTRNQMLQTHLDAANFGQLTRRLDSVTADLRETVMQARLQPVGHLFGKFPRMVRDLARSCGKRVRIEFAGQETGLDKNLLEAIKDPLTHAVRNAVDHGIESAETRERAGKPAEGLVRLSAYQQNGSVVIEIADDGGGIAAARVLEKAIERGMVTPERASTMSEREVLQLVFHAGFSTADKVTHVSGRGVGMDVVRANVEQVGGTVELTSKVGQGTVLRLRVPLTLAIVGALVVRSGGHSFCLPQAALAELVYIPRRDADRAIERVGGAQVYRLRERLLPVVWLDELLRVGGQATREPHGFYLAVLEAEGMRYGLVVDDLMAPEEIVVKPLSGVLRELGVFSGATVLGSGALAMILDVPAVAVRAGVQPERERRETETGGVEAEMEVLGNAPDFLVFEDRVHHTAYGLAADEGRGAEPRMERRALPLKVVERIEEVPFGEVEYAHGRPMLQYRGELLPLEDDGGVLADDAPAGSDLTVLICLRPGSGGPGAAMAQRVGIVVRRVLDVASGSLLSSELLERAQVHEGRLALVKSRLTVVHEAFSESPQTTSSERWKDVA